MDLVDESFIAADVAQLAAVVADSTRWKQWFPDLDLTIFMDRGLQGIRWSVSGQFHGSTEIWLEEFGDGVIVHYYLRVDPVDSATGQVRPFDANPAGYRKAAKVRVAAAQRWKRNLWALKDELERDREPGTPAASAQ